MDSLITEGRILFGDDETQIIQIKEYLNDYEGKLSSVINLDSRAGANEMEALLDDRKVFPHPKPAILLKGIFDFCLEDHDLVLDFFAGSGTTAHAVLDLNKQDGGKRKFILVQLPEPTERKDFPTIADITKERIRRVIKKLNEEDEQASPSRRSRESGNPDLFVTDELDSRVRGNDGGSNQPQDRGFKVFKLGESNFKPWNADGPHDVPTLEKQLDLHVDHIRDNRTADDLLYEILLKSGFPLSTPVEDLKLAGKTVHSVAGGALFICLERVLTLELIRAMADKKPERVVCLDEGFADNDQVKANAVQIFKTKGVTSFKTV
jgi:adenine-specific DNA-methyltransferase